MKVEKVETIKNQYLKFEKLNQKSKKTKIGIIVASAIAFKSRCVSAFIPGDMPTHIEIEPEYIDNSKYTTLGYIVMLIFSIISSIVVKLKWKNYDSKQKKIAKIILPILFTITLLLVLITIILKSKM